MLFLDYECKVHIFVLRNVFITLISISALLVIYPIKQYDILTYGYYLSCFDNNYLNLLIIELIEMD